MPNKNIGNFLVSGFSDDEEGIDVDRNPSEEDPRLFLKAAERGDLEVVKSMLKKDKSLVNASDREGYTALHRACYSNHEEVVKYLLQNGANIAAKTELLWEPLHSCCQWNNLKCAEILLAEGADVNARSEGGQTPLHIAASQGACYDIVQMLLLHPYINTKIRNANKDTAFDIARRNSKYRNVFDMVDPLLNIKNIELE